MEKRLIRLGAIAYTVYAGKQKGITVGHTLLQKLFYFLQHGRDIDLGYRYRLHHFGPYCKELWADLNYLEDVNALSVKGSPSGFGYNIFPEAKIETLLELVNDEIKEEISELLNFLSHRPVRELECLATTHYVCKEIQEFKEDPENSKNNVINGVLALKPHLTEKEVLNSMEILRKKCLI